MLVSPPTHFFVMFPPIFVPIGNNIIKLSGMPHMLESNNHNDC